jgi:hypothetical protein
MKSNSKFNQLNAAFLFIALLFVHNASAQWDNPANRYLEVYRDFQDATCPIEENEIKHFVYFARDREAIQNHPFLTNKRFSGAQIMYSWRELEPEKGSYDFSSVKEDYDYLSLHGKKLFIQLQDATFSLKYRGIPEYLLTDEYDGGAAKKIEEEGWVAHRWNPAVQHRFALLLQALGRAFDGKIEGINLQETAIGIDEGSDLSFSPQRYAAAIRENMLALKTAFPNSCTMQYANFMPGEWLPWEDQGYLRSIYAYGEKIGVGLGSPDLMIQRKAQLNHALAMMHENEYSVPLGIAVQDGNYIGKTGADQDYDESTDSAGKQRVNIVPMLHVFARDFLNVKYMFWVNQEPYFTEDVLPCFQEKQKP